MSWTLSTLHHLIISWTCKCIHIHEGTDAKLTVAGTRRTVPTAQSASSTYRKRGEGVSERGCLSWRRERGGKRSKTKERKKQKQGKRRGGKTKDGLHESKREKTFRVTWKVNTTLPLPSWVAQTLLVTWVLCCMKWQIKKPECIKTWSWLRRNGAWGTQGQMEGGAAVRGEQMAAANLIYEINNVSRIEFRNRNTLPEF